MATNALKITVADIRKKFAEENETTRLESKVQALNTLIDGCYGRRMIRRRNRMLALKADALADIERRKKKQEVFEFLTTDLEHALVTAQAAYKQQQRQERIVRQSMQAAGRKDDDMEQKGEKELALKRTRQQAADAALLYRDLVLIDDGQAMQDAREMVDDVCPNCETLMHRNIQTSCLICPNLDCQFMREYIDTSSYSNQTYTMRDSSSGQKNSNVTHYSAFLNTCQGRTSRKFSREFLFQICYFLRAEGVTSADQITKKLVNRAQKYFMPKNEYNISVILGTILRGDALRFPPEVVKKMHLLFRAIWPIFNRWKCILEPTRRNMANFDFFSRVMVRLLGYDVLLPRFTQFDLDANEVRHYAFMRRIFREMGWEWSDQLSDVSEEDLDEYEKRHSEEIDRAALDGAW